MHHFLVICELNQELKSGSAQFWSKWVIFFVPCYLEIWQTNLKNNRTPLLCHFKLSRTICEFKLDLWFENSLIGSIQWLTYFFFFFYEECVQIKKFNNNTEQELVYTAKYCTFFCSLTYSNIKVIQHNTAWCLCPNKSNGLKYLCFTWILSVLHSNSICYHKNECNNNFGRTMIITYE